MIDKIEDIEVTKEMIIRAKDKIPIIKFPTDYEIKQAIQLAIEVSEEIQELIAENKRLREANEWQPIDTAPEQILVMVWQKYNNEWGIWWGHKVANDWFVKFGNEWLQSQPTHWRPLPQQPKEQE